MIDYTVIGGGISGIVSICVLHSKYPNSKILWIDSHSFSGGDLRKYPEVPANTPTPKLIGFIQTLYELLGICNTCDDACESIGDNKFKLDCLVNELVKISSIIKNMENISITSDHITHIDYTGGFWSLKGAAHYTSQKVVLAIGSTQKKLNYDIPEIPLEVALNPKKLRTLNIRNNKITVFGNSHSGVLVLKNLVELGIQNIQNIIRSPIRIPHFNSDGVEIYMESGIRGIGLNWVLQNIVPENKTNIQINTYCENLTIESDYVIYAIGLAPRHIQITSGGQSLQKFKNFNEAGLLFTNLYGIGAAFPKYYTLYGINEYEIGMWEFLERALAIF